MAAGFNLTTLTASTVSALFTGEPVTSGTAYLTSTSSATDAHHTQDAAAHALQQIRFLMYNLLIPVVTIAGTLGNSINIVVLTRRWMRSSTNYYLTALAYYDIAYLVCVLLLTRFGRSGAPVWLLRPMADTCSNTGVWLTLTFTIERYIGVCHPMKGRVLCTPQRAFYCIIGVCTSGAILTAPEFFHSSLTGRSSYDTAYVTLLQTLFTFVPLTLLIVFNYFLVRSVVRASIERNRMCRDSSTKSGANRQASEQHRVTTMLIIVVVVFIVCQLPQAIVNSLRLNHRDSRVLIVNNIVNFLVIINAAINFILYSCMSSKFRRTFAHLLSVMRYRLWRVGGGGDSSSGGGAYGGGGSYAPPFSLSGNGGGAGGGGPPISRHRGSSAASGVTLRNRSTAAGATSGSSWKGKDGTKGARDRLTLLTPLSDEAHDLSAQSNQPTTSRAAPGNGSGSKYKSVGDTRFVITVLAPSPEGDRLLSREVITGVPKQLASPHSSPYVTPQSSPLS